jgi:preprotein translocase subunit SecA
MDKDAAEELVCAWADRVYAEREELFGEMPDGSSTMRELERVVMLRVVDEFWMDHIDIMADLKDSVFLQAYANQKPIDVYKKEGFEMFEEMNDGIRKETVRRMFTVQVRKNETIERKEVAKANTPAGDGTLKKQPIKKKKIGRKQRIASFVEQHYREKLSLTQLAQEEGITAAYMSRIFAELFSDSFQEYLSKMRLQKAINLLKQSNIYLVDICMECGFSDTRYLNAICQKEYGCSAMALREKMQNPEWQDPHQEPEAAELTLDDAESLRILKIYIEK